MKAMCARHWTTEAMILSPPRRRDIIEEELDGEVILFDPQSGNTYRLNQTASAVWRRCDRPVTTRELAEELTQAYDVELETALDDVEQLVAFFGQSRLLDLSSRL
jgi:PqqD family protein of HPr-rel-A system